MVSLTFKISKRWHSNSSFTYFLFVSIKDNFGWPKKRTIPDKTSQGSYYNFCNFLFCIIWMIGLILLVYWFEQIKSSDIVKSYNSIVWYFHISPFCNYHYCYHFYIQRDYYWLSMHAVSYKITIIYGRWIIQNQVRNVFASGADWYVDWHLKILITKKLLFFVTEKKSLSPKGWEM